MPEEKLLSAEWRTNKLSPYNSDDRSENRTQDILVEDEIGLATVSTLLSVGAHYFLWWELILICSEGQTIHLARHLLTVCKSSYRYMVLVCTGYPMAT